MCTHINIYVCSCYMQMHSSIEQVLLTLTNFFIAFLRIFCDFLLSARSFRKVFVALCNQNLTELLFCPREVFKHSWILPWKCNFWIVMILKSLCCGFSSFLCLIFKNIFQLYGPLQSHNYIMRKFRLFIFLTFTAALSFIKLKQNRKFFTFFL